MLPIPCSVSYRITVFKITIDEGADPIWCGKVIITKYAAADSAKLEGGKLSYRGWEIPTLRIKHCTQYYHAVS